MPTFSTVKAILDAARETPDQRAARIDHRVRFAPEPQPLSGFGALPQAKPHLSVHGRALLSITQAMHACEALPHDEGGHLARALSLLDEAGSALDQWYAPRSAA